MPLLVNHIGYLLNTIRVHYTTERDAIYSTIISVFLDRSLYILVWNYVNVCSCGSCDIPRLCMFPFLIHMIALSEWCLLDVLFSPLAIEECDCQEVRFLADC